MTGFKSKKAAALDEEGMYLVHQTAQPAQELTMQEQLDIARADWRQAHVDCEKARAEVVRIEKLLKENNNG